MPVEATENVAPVVFWRKEFRPDSGGPGRWRGGLGQILEIGGLQGIPFSVLAMFDRVIHPPRGRDGGMAGWAGKVGLASEKPLKPKGEQTIHRNDRLLLELPGGGGFGSPLDREPERVAEDVRNGVVSVGSARSNYRKNKAWERGRLARMKAWERGRLARMKAWERGRLARMLDPCFSES